jgi:N-acetylglucosamine-6-sulfatase
VGGRRKRSIFIVVGALAVFVAGCVTPTPPPGAPVPRFDLSLSTPSPEMAPFSLTATPVNFVPTSVEFRLDALAVAPFEIVNAAPYTVAIDPSKLSVGKHTVWATGTDGTYTVRFPVGFTVGQPNVVWVMTDDMRPDEFDGIVSAKPGGGFDWLKQHGTRFSKMWVSDNLCCPGRTSALTGQTAFNHKVFENDVYPLLNETAPLWAQRAGYCTGLAGKYLNAYNERSAKPPGWTYWEPIINNQVDSYDYTEMQRDGTVTSPGEYLTTHLGAVADKQLDDCLNAKKPALVAFWPTAPHFGTTPEPAYADAPVSWSPTDPSFNEADISDKPQWLQNWHPTAPANAAAYYLTWETGRMRTLMSVDDALKKLIDDLDTRGQLTKTLFVVQSDNGWYLGEHRIDSRKRLAYEAGQGDLWIAGPGFAPNVASDAYDMNIDIAPTIARATHGVAGLTMDGRALQDVLADPSLGHDRFLPIHVPAEGEASIQPTADAVRTWHYKYVKYADGSDELYDLVADPYELSNATNDPSYAGIKTAMISLLQTAMTCSGDACRAPAPVALQ